MSDRKLPKSLHTVTALVNLGRFFVVSQMCAKPDAIRYAVATLRLDTLHDAYGLAKAALAQLEKEA